MRCLVEDTLTSWVRHFLHKVLQVNLRVQIYPDLRDRRRHQ